VGRPLRTRATAQRACVLCFAGALIASVPASSAAQESRAAELRARRAEKARSVVPHKPTLFEKLSTAVGEKESGGRPLGFYPYFGSIFTGGAVAVGVGYRVPFKDTGALTTEVAISPKLYWKFDTRLRLPEFADRRVRIEARALYLDAPKVNFFGVGNDSIEDDKATFRLKAGTLLGTVLVRPLSWMGIGGGIDYVNNNLGSGKIEPSIEEIFTPDEVPGLGDSPDYFVTRAFVQVDTRDVSGDFAGTSARVTRAAPRLRSLTPSYATRGGFARVDFASLSATSDLPYDFDLIDTAAGYLIPILRDNWVIALRAQATFTRTGGDNEVPYFLLPTLGSSRDLRGFDNFRFRDRNKLLLTAEYRWAVSPFADMVVFYDAGKVAPDASDLDFSDLKNDYGVGIRFHTRSTAIMRFEVARSDERMRFIFGVGASF